jgi:hypothetical protein
MVTMPPQKLSDIGKQKKKKRAKPSVLRQARKK